MKQARIIATIKKCRIPYVEIPIQEQTPKAQPYLESGLKRNLLLYRYGEAKTRGAWNQIPIQEKIHATQSYLESGSAKGESTLVSTQKPQRTAWSADTREDSRHPVLSGKWWRER